MNLVMGLDKAGKAVIVCSIENMDPMGVHTGDSITVAPIQTLTDREYQAMRDDSIAVLRKIGIATGGSNVQWAVDPKTGRRIIIEMNPRVSRSSALASKATGFPIAKIAALLAVGYTLDEIRNDITGETLACFEPTLDYVVVKIPRFAFEKFPGCSTELGTQMKAVGEVMAIGRTFKQAYLKAVRSLEAPLRYHDESTYDPWFKRELAEIEAFRRMLRDGRMEGIEFDWCCCHAAFALRKRGYEVVMVNSNPETVSTDCETSDRLSFEPQTFEDVMEIYDRERCSGVIVQFCETPPHCRTYEPSACRERRRGLDDRGQSARVTDGAVRLEGDWRASRRHRGAVHGRRKACGHRLHAGDRAALHVGQGGGLPFREVPGRGGRAGARDA